MKFKARANVSLDLRRWLLFDKGAVCLGNMGFAWGVVETIISSHANKFRLRAFRFRYLNVEFLIFSALVLRQPPLIDF